MLKILICEDEKDWSDHFKNLIHEKFEKPGIDIHSEFSIKWRQFFYFCFMTKEQIQDLRDRLESLRRHL